MDSGDECVQRIVLAALGPELVREAEEVFLVDRVQHRACRLLDDLAFECGHDHIELHFGPVGLWVRLRSPIPFIRFAVSGLWF